MGYAGDCAEGEEEVIRVVITIWCDGNLDDEVHTDIVDSGGATSKQFSINMINAGAACGECVAGFSKMEEGRAYYVEAAAFRECDGVEVENKSASLILTPDCGGSYTVSLV
jgi:hypothetical protein